MLRPLTAALSGNPKALPWKPDMETTFTAAKAALVAGVPLAHPLPGAVLALETYSSNTHVGAVLQQQVGQHWQPLGFFSKKLSKTELTPICLLGWAKAGGFPIQAGHTSYRYLHFLMGDGMFKRNTNIDCHGPRLMSNSCQHLDPPNFSLPTTFTGCSSTVVFILLFINLYTTDPLEIALGVVFICSVAEP
jgi:hypothetical protein